MDCQTWPSEFGITIAGATWSRRRRTESASSIIITFHLSCSVFDQKLVPKTQDDYDVSPYKAPDSGAERNASSRLQLQGATINYHLLKVQS